MALGASAGKPSGTGISASGVGVEPRVAVAGALVGALNAPEIAFTPVCTTTVGGTAVDADGGLLAFSGDANGGKTVKGAADIAGFSTTLLNDRGDATPVVVVADAEVVAGGGNALVPTSAVTGGAADPAAFDAPVTGTSGPPVGVRPATAMPVADTVVAPPAAGPPGATGTAALLDTSPGVCVPEEGGTLARGGTLGRGACVPGATGPAAGPATCVTTGSVTGPATCVATGGVTGPAAGPAALVATVRVTGVATGTAADGAARGPAAFIATKPATGVALGRGVGAATGVAAFGATGCSIGVVTGAAADPAAPGAT